MSDVAASDLKGAARLRAVLARASSNARLRQRGQCLHARCLIEMDGEALGVLIDAGEIRLLDRWPPLTHWTLTLRANADVWERFWQSPPPPGWHDLLALTKRGELHIDGDLHCFMSHLQYFKDLLALPRPIT